MYFFGVNVEELKFGLTTNLHKNFFYVENSFDFLDNKLRQNFIFSNCLRL